ncbi:hypothetical protein KSP39_PZI016658 [Platanthera zijinensis]|uniref:Integrase catalytic domain-containing protein n=1 Tax=Platanthera zijinensis TaxID=2320716 RepID=A0AAP0G134_9ASPA
MGCISWISYRLLSAVSIIDWHRRLGHAPLPILKRALPDVPLREFSCESCIYDKQHRSSFPPACTRSSTPLSLVHSDVWSPYRVPSIFGFRYFVTFIDDYSRTTWLYLLHDRIELTSVFRAFLLEMRTQFATPLRVIRTDNAREYTGRTSNLCTEFVVIHQTSCAYTPQQNGVAERKNRHLLDVARSLMFQMHVLIEYWNFAVSTVRHLINRLPSSVLNFVPPIQLLYPSTNLTSLTPRIFGCVCYVHLLGSPSDKLAPRAAKYMFVGYSRTQKGYVCYSPSDGKLVVSADVTFCEDQPFHLPSTTSSSAPSIPRPAVPVTPSLSSSSSSPHVPPQVPPPLTRVYSRRPSKDAPVTQLPATSDTSATADPAPSLQLIPWPTTPLSIV